MSVILKKCIQTCRNDENYYSTVLSSVKIPDDFFWNNIDIFNLEYLVTYCTLEQESIKKILDYNLTDSLLVLTKQILTNDTIEYYFKLAQHIDLILEFQDVPCNLLTKYKYLLNMDMISKNQFLDLKFLVENIDTINWKLIPLNHKMIPHINEGFITLFQSTKIWDNIGYSDIDTDTLFKYKHFFTDDTYKSLSERNDD